MLFRSYTVEGGVKTIVWTDTLQTACMLFGLAACTYFLLGRLELSPTQALAQAQDHGLAWVWGTDPLSRNFWLKQVVAGAFITLTMTGMDQEMMQKNISVKTLKNAQKNMLSFSLVLILVNFLFLFLGGVLQLYKQGLQLPVSGDRLFPDIAFSTQLPWIMSLFFMIGLVSALFPSADGALTAVTASYCVDVLNMENRHDINLMQKTQIRKKIHLIMALVFLICVFVFKELDQGSLIQLLLKIAALTYGPLLGLFAFGIFTQHEVSKTGIVVSCLFAPALSYIIQYACNQFYQYQFGPELLLLNGLIAFSGLWLFKTYTKNASLKH